MRNELLTRESEEAPVSVNQSTVTSRPAGVSRPSRARSTGRRRLLGLSVGQNAAAHAVLIALCIPALLPLLRMVSTSLKTDKQIYDSSGAPSISTLLPHPIAWSNYVGAVHAIPFGMYLKNTKAAAETKSASRMLDISAERPRFMIVSWMPPKDSCGTN